MCMQTLRSPAAIVVAVFARAYIIAIYTLFVLSWVLVGTCTSTVDGLICAVNPLCWQAARWELLSRITPRSMGCLPDGLGGLWGKSWGSG